MLEAVTRHDLTSQGKNFVITQLKQLGDGIDNNDQAPPYSQRARLRPDERHQHNQRHATELNDQPRQHVA